MHLTSLRSLCMHALKASARSDLQKGPISTARYVSSNVSLLTSIMTDFDYCP
jgi:hypothetical protein